MTSPPPDLSEEDVTTPDEPDQPDQAVDQAADQAVEQAEPDEQTQPDALEGRSIQGSLSALDLPLRPSLEAVLMVADQPLDHLSLAQAVGAPPAEVEAALHALAEEYTEQGRGFDLRRTGGGWRFYTREEYAAVVEQFVVDGQQARLTQASLETLAVVAYRQPISRARVSAIRGVNVDGVIRTLVTRGLVEEAGSDAETGAHLYRTTSYFLERMGLTGLDELPEIAPFLPEMADVEGELEELAGVDHGVAPSSDAADQPPADQLPADQLPDDQVSGGEPADGQPADGADATQDGVPEDGVPEDGVPEDGVPEDGVPEDGVPAEIEPGPGGSPQ